MTLWMKILGGVGVGAGVAFCAVLWQGNRRWQAQSDELHRRLHAKALWTRPATYSETELEGLPAPVARYFRTVLRPGQPIIQRAWVTWEGEFNMGKPGQDNWKAFTAVQEFVPTSSGFVWNARIAALPAMPVLVRDAFAGGVGSMQGTFGGLFSVVDRAGTPEIATAALQRYLGEAVWFPTALLPGQGVSWSPINDTNALATIQRDGVTVSLEFRFGADGLVESVYAPDRTYDDGKTPPKPMPWQARNLRYEERQGILVPVDSTVEWLFPSGVYAYWRGKPTKIEYEYATPIQ